ncbi:Opacity protein opA54, partial [Neisseria gonorrhoeae]
MRPTKNFSSLLFSSLLFSSLLFSSLLFPSAAQAASEDG